MNEIEVVCLFYYPDENVFRDGDFGNIVWNIFEFITPNDLYLLRTQQQFMIVRHRTMPGVLCELHCPSEDEYYYSRDECMDYS